MKIKIDFTKLIYEDYSHFDLDIGLEVVNWFLATGLKGDYQRRSGWYISGINQLIYGYSSCNDNDHATPFPMRHQGSLRGFLTSIFSRAVLSPTASHGGSKEIEAWRTKNRIGFGKYRFLDLPDDKTNRNVSGLLYRISLYEKKELKKKYAHPDFPLRTRPKIIDLTFSTSGEGYFIKIMFSFWEYNYEPGWTEYIATQKKGEYIGDFLARAEKKLKQITVNTEATKRLSFETKTNFKTFTEKGCYNCIWIKKDKEFYCGQMAFYHRHRQKWCAIDNPCNHCCDEWEYKFPDEK